MHDFELGKIASSMRGIRDHQKRVDKALRIIEAKNTLTKSQATIINAYQWGVVESLTTNELAAHLKANGFGLISNKVITAEIEYDAFMGYLTIDCANYLVQTSPDVWKLTDMAKKVLE